MALLLALPAVADLAAAAPAAVADHVIISEIMALANTATNRPLCSEYVEIHNPTAAAIDLGQYFLTDATFTTNSQFYWRLAEADPSATTAGGGTFADFHAKFPAGYSIAAGDTVVIAIEGSTKYLAAYGRLPDFELYEDGAAPDAVPELVEVFPGSVNAGTLAGGTNTPTLTDSSESLILYRWNGSTDLVQDVDYVRWGTTTSVIVNKTGVTVGASTYLPDSATQQTIAATSAPGTAYMRASADEGAEATTGGNGLTGHNETSENFTATWAATPQDPALAPGAAYVTAPIITAHGQVPAIPVIGEAVTVSVSARSSTAIAAVTFRYAVDGGPATALAGDPAGTDTWSAVIPAQAPGAVVRWYATVDNSAGGSVTYPSAAPRFTTSWTVIAPPAPVITGFATTPATPSAQLPTTVSVTATSLSALTGAVFHYSVGGGAFAALTGSAEGGGVYTATVPAQVEGTVVTWYAVVTNQAGLSTSSPADAPTTTHGWTVAPEAEPKLLLTEICTIPAAGEFIEIWNPGARSLDLSDYYLTDATFRNETGYWLMGGGSLSAGNVGGGSFNDFTARFPDGYVIAGGDTIVVSVAGSSAFSNQYGFMPDLELYEDDSFPDGVPDMRSVFEAPGNSIAGVTTPTLTEAGETVVLFKWTAGTNLVIDVDVFVWIAGGVHNFCKAGKSVGGSTYAPETAILQQDPFGATLSVGSSYVRIDATEGTQILTGSNGVDGRDELSERWNQTFAIRSSDPAAPGSVGDGAVELVVPAKTFLPSLGETFPVRITSRPRSETRVRLYDREGRLVRTLFDSRTNGAPSTTVGSYTTIAWNGLDETLQRVGSGLYVVHLWVVDKTTGVEETRTAPVVVTTRLSR